jgi:hypothetical protein
MTAARRAARRADWLSPAQRLWVVPRPVAMQDNLQARLRAIEGPELWLSGDLSDPLPALRQASNDPARLDHITWRALAELAELDRNVADRVKGHRTHLPTAQALASESLGPVLERLLGALGGGVQNERSWTYGESGEVHGTLYALNAVTFEGIRLKLTQDGLTRWPALDPGDLTLEQLWERYPVTWVVPVAKLDALIDSLSG